MVKQFRIKVFKKLIHLPKESGCVDIFISEDSQISCEEIKRRAEFFLAPEGLRLNIVKTKTLPIFLKNISLAAGYTVNTFYQKFYSNYFFNVDYITNPFEGWEYHFFLNTLLDVDFKKYQNQLLEFKRVLSSKGLSKAYVFGTGPSLQNAHLHNWQDGIRIVCNTIVKDKELWHHINPHIITAGDGIYHFGISMFAENFRKDLKLRLTETPETIFVYPSFFHKFCLREFKGFEDRLFPVPFNYNTMSIDHNLCINYFLPNASNVLPMLLLPVACSFSKDVNLWGFDGKAPNDKDFWKNSDKQFYQDKVDDLKSLHPSFYTKMIPSGKESSYVTQVHGDQLENMLTIGERNGYKFTMLHKTYTPVLEKRMHN